MPTVSKKQEKFMQAVAHNPAFAKKAGVPQSVGKEFTKSGGGMKKGSTKKMAMGGMGQKPLTPVANPVSRPPSKPSGPAVSRPPSKPTRPGIGMKNGGMTASKMGAVKTAAPSRDGVAVKGKTKGKQIVMAGNKRMNKGGYC
jgi:hypothetical protein